MAPENQISLKKLLAINGNIFKFLITYAHLKQQSLLETFGSEIPFPVCSPKNGFSWLTRELINGFSKSERQITTLHSIDVWHYSFLKIYFSFRLKYKKLERDTFFDRNYSITYGRVFKIRTTVANRLFKKYVSVSVGKNKCAYKNPFLRKYYRSGLNVYRWKPIKQLLY